MASSEQICGGRVSRRNVLAGAAGAVAGITVGARAVLADDDVSAQFKEALKIHMSGRPVLADPGVTLTLPELAENGNMVPFTVSVASPMTEEDYVRSITLFSTGNPQPVIATFHLSPVSGRAVVSGRLRLARSQDVVAAAELSSGALILGRANVKVTIGGCGSG